MKPAQIVFLEDDSGRLPDFAMRELPPHKGRWVEAIATSYGRLLSPDHAVDTRGSGPAKSDILCGVSILMFDAKYYVTSFQQGGDVGSRRYNVSIPVETEGEALAEAFNHQARLIRWAGRRFKIAEEAA